MTFVIPCIAGATNLSICSQAAFVVLPAGAEVGQKHNRTGAGSLSDGGDSGVGKILVGTDKAYRLIA
jgi:hypothetical protein